MNGKKKRYRPDRWQEARRKWVGKWVWFDYEMMGTELALVRGISCDGEILLSSHFYEELSEGGLPLPVCEVAEAERLLKVLSREELEAHGKRHLK